MICSFLYSYLLNTFLFKIELLLYYVSGIDVDSTNIETPSLLKEDYLSNGLEENADEARKLEDYSLNGYEISR